MKICICVCLCVCVYIYKGKLYRFIQSDFSEVVSLSMYKSIYLISLNENLKMKNKNDLVTKSCIITNPEKNLKHLKLTVNNMILQ